MCLFNKIIAKVIFYEFFIKKRVFNWKNCKNIANISNKILKKTILFVYLQPK